MTNGEEKAKDTHSPHPGGIHIPSQPGKETFPPWHHGYFWRYTVSTGRIHVVFVGGVKKKSRGGLGLRLKKKTQGFSSKRLLWWHHGVMFFFPPGHLLGESWHLLASNGEWLDVFVGFWKERVVASQRYLTLGLSMFEYLISFSAWVSEMYRNHHISCWKRIAGKFHWILQQHMHWTASYDKPWHPYASSSWCQSPLITWKCKSKLLPFLS